MRSAQLQTWPVLMMRDWVIALAARSRSASLSTIAGALPPSSRLTSVRFGAAARMIAMPVGTLPVKQTMIDAGMPAQGGAGGPAAAGRSG